MAKESTGKKRGRPPKKKMEGRVRPQPVEADNEYLTPVKPMEEEIKPLIEDMVKPVEDDAPEPKPTSVRFTGSHQVCPRCGAYDTKTYKSMPIDERTGIRVQYRRCQRAICRNEFKATFKVS